MQAMPLYPYPCIYYSITDYVLSSMYSDLSPVPVISEVQSYITGNRWFAQRTIRARARNIHRIARIISYIAQIIQSQRDNIVSVSTVSTRLVLAAW